MPLYMLAPMATVLHSERAGNWKYLQLCCIERCAQHSSHVCQHRGPRAADILISKPPAPGFDLCLVLLQRLQLGRRQVQLLWRPQLHALSMQRVPLPSDHLHSIAMRVMIASGRQAKLQASVLRIGAVQRYHSS